jgi:hypothetical protein
MDAQVAFHAAGVGLMIAEVAGQLAAYYWRCCHSCKLN